jgi:di/tricarboxylate transporter
VGDALPSINFKTAIWFVGLAALGEALKSTGTILTGLEKTHPLYTGNV